MSVSEIRRVSLKELRWYAQGVNERRFEEFRQAVSVAHLTAALSRIPVPSQGKRDPFPKLSEVLPTKSKQAHEFQNDEDRRAAVLAWFEMNLSKGQKLPITKGNKIKKAKK